MDRDIPKISIHAPLTGSDAGLSLPGQQPGHFNPRSPYGERQITGELSPTSWRFQSTLPLRGATPVFRWQHQREHISIHAPLTGSDVRQVKNGCVPQDFNPRSPYGERRRSPSKREQAAEFQSTLPLRGATMGYGTVSKWAVISIHAPLTGSDLR